MSTGLEASTVTPGRTAPDGSRTTPAIEACAAARAGARRTAHNVTTNQGPRGKRMAVAPFSCRCDAEYYPAERTAPPFALSLWPFALNFDRQRCPWAAGGGGGWGTNMMMVGNLGG